MNGAIQLVSSITIFSIIAGSASGKSGRELVPDQTISIRLYDQAQASERVLHSATDEANWLFRTARIRISWGYPSTRPPEDQGIDMTSPAFQQAAMRPDMVVRLLKRTPETIFPGALGFALPFAQTGANVLIFYDRVEALAHRSDKETYLVLAYAMAHEIGHVLLGSSDHARGGLMQARWTSDTLGLASSGLLVFTRGESQRMHARLQAVQGPNRSGRQY